MKFSNLILACAILIAFCFAAPGCETYDQCLKCENHVFLNGQCKEQKCLDQSSNLKNTSLLSKITNNDQGFNIQVDMKNNELTQDCFEDKLTDKNKNAVSSFQSSLKQFSFQILKTDLNTLCIQSSDQNSHIYNCAFTYDLILAGQLQTTFNINVTIKIDKITNTSLDLTVEALQKDHQISAEPITPTSSAVVKLDKTYTEDRKNAIYKLGDVMYIQLQLDDVFLQSNYNVELVKAVLVTPELDYIPLTPVIKESAPGGKLQLSFKAQWVRDNITMLLTGKLVPVQPAGGRRALADQQQYKDMTQSVSFSVQENSSSPSEQATDSSNTTSVAQSLAVSAILCLLVVVSLI